MKEFFKKVSEFREGILIGVFVIGGLALVAWYKSGGRFDAFVGFFIALIIILIIGIIVFVIINLVRDYLDNRKNK